MSGKTVRQDHTQDRQLRRSQEDQQGAVGRLNRCPFIDGNLLEDVTVVTAAGGTALEHKLGRAPRGYFPTKLDTACTSLFLVEQDTRTITLRALTADFTGDVWVF